MIGRAGPGWLNDRRGGAPGGCVTGGGHVTQLAGPPKMAVCVAVIAKEVRTRVGGRPCSALAFVLALRLPASLPLGPRRDERTGFEDPRGSGQFREAPPTPSCVSAGASTPGPHRPGPPFLPCSRVSCSLLHPAAPCTPVGQAIAHPD